MPSSLRNGVYSKTGAGARRPSTGRQELSSKVDDKEPCWYQGWGMDRMQNWASCVLFKSLIRIRKQATAQWHINWLCRWYWIRKVLHPPILVRERGQKNQGKGQELGQEMTIVNLSYGQEGKEPVFSGWMKGLAGVESTYVGNHIFGGCLELVRATLSSRCISSNGTNFKLDIEPFHSQCCLEGSGMGQD